MSEVELSLFGTAKLGVVIDALKCAPAEASVYFDFCYLSPARVASYRGYYDHVAIGWTSEGDWPTAAEVIARLEAAVGETFEGWKGGRYRMTRETPLWVANAGEAGGTGIVGVDIEGESTVILRTAKVD